MDREIYYSYFDSPIGTITLVADEEALRAVHIEDDRYFQGIDKEWVHAPHNKILEQAQEELTDYFKGRRRDFSVPVVFEGTDFQEKVWNALRYLPYGQTSSYGEIAVAIGRPKAVRAVGTAVGRNPLCIVVPCHRVLASDGTLGGYVAGVGRKQYLLDLERHE